MSRITESLYRVNGIELTESNLDKSVGIINKICKLIEKNMPKYDVVCNDNSITVSNGINTETFTVRADQVTKYTLVSSIYGDDFTNINEVYSPQEFTNTCVGRIVEYLKDK